MKATVNLQEMKSVQCLPEPYVCICYMHMKGVHSSSTIMYAHLEECVLTTSLVPAA